MTCPLVSVLMPVRNAADTLDEAMASTLEQTFGDLELVAVDDGSTDGTRAMLGNWAARDGRVQVVSGTGDGLVGALQRGLASCRGRYVARMDADDVSHPRRLEAQLALLAARPEVAVVATQVLGMATDGGPLLPGMTRYLTWMNELLEPDEMARARFIESPVVHPTVVVRREVLLAAGGYQDRGWPEDYDLWLRLLDAGVRFAKVPRPLLAWRDHPGRATRTHPRYGPGRLRALKIHHLMRGPLRIDRPVVLCGAGLEGKPILRALRARGVRVPIVLEVDPRKVGNVIHGARAVAPDQLAAALRALPGAVMLAAVGVPSARPEIRALARAAGLVEGESFFFVR